MKNIIRVHALWFASVLTLLFAPMSAEAQKALVYCPAIDQSGCTTVRTALTSAFPGGVDIADDGANGTVDLKTADLFQYAVFFVPSLAETDSAAPYTQLRDQVVADRLKLALIGRRAFWSGTPDQGVTSTTRAQKDALIRSLAAWASADFGTVNAPGLVVLQDNSDVITRRYSWVQPILGFNIIADPKLASYSSVRSLTAAGNAILSNGGSTLAYANMASFGFQTPSGASGVSLDAVGQTGTSVGGQVVLLTQMGANTGGAVIRTDTDDYSPGTPVIMTGTGFQGGETVTLTLHEDPLLHPDRVHSATADANGGFVYSGFAPEDHDVDVRFVLTAKGQTSGRQAQTTFTDANAFTYLASPASVTAGSTNTFTFTFTGSNAGNNPTAQTVAIPNGWTAPRTTSGAGQVSVSTPSGSTCSIGTVTVSGQQVTINGTNTCTNGGAFTLTYSNATAPSPASPPQSYVFALVSSSTGPSVTVTAGKQNQATVSVTNMPSSPQQFGASFTVGGTGGSGTGAYNFSATGACSVGLTSGVVTITASAGVCSITSTRLGDADFFESSPSAAATVNATVATQPAVTLTVPASVTYPTGFTASASGGVAGATYSYSTVSTACSVTQSTGVVTVNSVGTCTITATAKSANYADATTTQSTAINPGTQPAVTLTVPAATTYPTGFTATASGGAAGATFAFSTLSTACSVVAASGVVTINSVGPCAITATATAANFADATATRTVDIGAAATTTVVTVANATYDGAPHGATATVTGPGGLNQSLAVSYVGRNGTSYAQSTTAPTGAGDYTASATYAAAGNYLGSSDSQNFTIGKATATIAVNGFTGAYDGAAHGASGTATGIGGVTLSGLDLGASFTSVPGGTATWTFTDATGNYSNATGTAPIVITKANATITVVGFTGVFDGLAHGATGTAKGIGGVSLAGLNLGSSFTNVPGGTASWSFTDATGNYNDASGSVEIAITKADASITVNGYTGVYDGNAHGATGSATGIGGASLTGLTLGASFTNVPGGTANWTFTDATGNYKDASGSVQISITKADATISVSGYTGVYDGAAHGATGTAKGIGGVGLTGLNLGASFANVPGGTANWSFTDATGNYNNASGTAAIVINKADATINVTGYTGVYDGNAHGASGSATGIGGGNLAGLDLGASFTNVPGGTATWKYTDATGNYNDASGTAAIVISKADATIAVSGYTGIYDGLSHSATGTASGVKGESLSGLNLGAAFTNVPGGTANWAYTDVTGNYNNASGTAAIVINKADATIVVEGYTGIYDGAAHGAMGTAKGVGGVTLAGLSLGNSFTNVPGGTASWTFTDATGNYNGASGTAAIVINKADATISVTGFTGLYDGNAHGATGTAKGIGGSSLAGLDLGASFTNVPGGTANWAFTDVTGNYNDVSGTAAIVITKADPTIAVTGYTGTYDGQPHGASGTATGAKGENLSGLNLGSSFTNVPGGTANWSYTDATGNYNNASGTAAIVIDKANATLAVDGYTGVYDGAAHGATGSAKGVGGVVLAGLTLGSSFTNVPGGTASWTFTDETGNYNNASGTAAVVISKANATIAVSGYTGVYDGAPHGATGSAKGVLGEGLAGLNLGSSFTNVPGGTASWTFTDATGNYNNASGTAAIVITKATIAAPILTNLLQAYAGVNTYLRPTVTVTPASVQVTLSFAQNGAPKGSNAGVNAVGVYEVTATITDQNYAGPNGDALFVVFDASGGFVTGGGFINSPLNACQMSSVCAGVTGKANFGFVSKYQKGANVPTGNTEFQFHAGNLNFKSSSYDWLVVAGSRAQYKGDGTINGVPGYKFILTAVDGATDQFRIKIMQISTSAIVYDNMVAASTTLESDANSPLSGPGTLLGGGSIQIQTK